MVLLLTLASDTALPRYPAPLTAGTLGICTLRRRRLPIQTVSEYNRATKFTYELRESRLKKCVRLLDSLVPGSLLDIGCSTGDWGLFWQARGWSPAGLDIDREHVGIARERGVDARYCDLNRQPIPCVLVRD